MHSGSRGVFRKQIKCSSEESKPKSNGGRGRNPLVLNGILIHSRPPIHSPSFTINSFVAESVIGVKIDSVNSEILKILYKPLVDCDKEDSAPFVMFPEVVLGR